MLNKFVALVALLLELAVELGWLLEFVESSVLELSVFQIWLKILGMFILHILQLSAGMFLLMCIASLASLETCFLSWSRILNCDMSALG